jgi:ribose/xylose/arabinose/galactoside ABC-type transport system permease subunit
MSSASAPASRREAWLAAALVLLVAVFSVLSGEFRSPVTFLDQSKFWAEIGILAPFALVVIVAGGIDLSVASVLALCGVTTVRLMSEHHLPVAAAVAIGLLLGAAAGAINGAIIVLARIPDLVVTLATLGIYRGLAQAVAQNRVYANLPPSYRFFGEASVAGVVPIQWLVLLAAWAAAFVILHRMRLGRYVYAVGSSPPAARFARVPAGATRILVYTLAGLSAAVAAVAHTACADTAKYDDAKGYELEAIACVVLGGASISGGRGSAVGLLLGVLLLGVLRTGLDLCGVPGEYKRFVTGAILIATAALNQRLANRVRSPGRS